MSGLAAIVLLVLGALSALFAWAVIRADRKDQEAYDRWYNDPRHVWNGAREAPSQPTRPLTSPQPAGGRYPDRDSTTR